MLKLMGHDFDRRLLDRVARVSKASATDSPPANVPTADSLLATAATLAAQLQALQRVHQQLSEQTPGRSSKLSELLDKLLERQTRLSQILCSAGLNLTGGDAPGEGLADYLAGPMDTPLRYEISVVLRELEFRLRELHRELLWRSEQLGAAEAARLREVVLRCFDQALAEVSAALRGAASGGEAQPVDACTSQT
jgi:hypothetical protein